MLRVRLAGGLQLELDGRELAPPASRRARAVLAWLALNPGPRARGELAGRFWPDVREDSARSSLRTALTELRRALGDGAAAVVATRDTVALSDDAWVDVRHFHRLLAAGRLDEAVGVAQGELLTGMDDDWVYEARAAHAGALASALERLAQAAERAGDLETAVRRSRDACALDPLAEAPARRLIARLAAAGDRSAALAVYERLGERLRTELAIVPSPATRALASELRAGPAPPPVPPPPALARARETPFAGRAAELGRMQRAWGDVVRDRERRLVLLSGEPGVGKTALALRLAVHARDAVVLLGRCSEEPLGAYEPFAEVLRHCAAALGSEALAAFAGPGATELARLLTAAEAQPDAGARHRLFAAVDAALAGVAGEHPLLLILDDLHWADRATLALLGALLRSRRCPLLVAGTCRTVTPELTRTLADLQRDRAADRLDLSGLTAADVAALAETWLGDARPAAAIHRRTGGNAFFVEEILRAARDHGDPIPQSVREAVAARRDGVGTDAQALLAAAAVLGLSADPAVVEGVAGVAAAEAALDELVAAHLLRPAGPAVEFPHALVREVVEGGLNPLRRRRLHRRAADALIARAGPPEQIAHHLVEAADTARAVEYLQRAGERAVGLPAYEEGAQFFARALALTDPAGARAGALELARGDALLRAGAPGARDCLATAAAIARRLPDPELLARVALAGLGVAIADPDPERVALLEEALAVVDDRALRSELLARLAVELYYERERSEALSAEAVAAAAGDPRAEAAALNARHVALWRPDRLRERLDTAARMLAAARVARARHLELQALNWRVTDLFELGDLPSWRVEVGRHAALADELRLPLFQWYTPLWAAVDALHMGRFTEAAALREQASAAGEAAGDGNARLFAQLLEIHEGFLRADFARVDLDLLRDKVARSPAGSAWRCGYTWCLAELGRGAEAQAHLAEIARDGFAGLPFDVNWLSAAGECAEACVILGAAGPAAALYARLTPYAGRPVTAGRALLHYGSADRHLGGLAAVLGRLDAAVAHYERAIALDAAAGLHPWVERARAGLARLRL